jgi:hypothetical protein
MTGIRLMQRRLAKSRPQTSTFPRFIDIPGILLADATKVLVMKEAAVKVLIAKKARGKI